MTLVIAMVAAVLLSSAAVGGTFFYLIRSGRLPMAKAAAVETPVVVIPPPAASHTMVLEPMVANLADASGAAYLKMALTLRIADEPLKKGSAGKEEKPAKGMSEAEAAVRDTVLAVVGRATSEELLAVDGKERLKQRLKTALAEHNPELKVMDLYFIDFLVQR
jgi:flagellar FliL protein